MIPVQLPRRTVRIGVTGLARAGKTAFLTSLAALLLSGGAAGRRYRIVPAPMGAGELPAFDAAGHLAALAADPPHWPARTGAVSLLALDLDVARTRYGVSLPARRLRLEMLDYPGEWLLDLPLLRQDYAAWSAGALRRLEQPDAAPHARDFLAFASALPARAGADERIAAEGHRLYAAALHRLRDEAGLVLLQPGRVLMPAPGTAPPWLGYFPLPGTASIAGGLGRLMADRYTAYGQAVRQELDSPLFGRLDRLVVLADVLGALHRGPAAFADTRAALTMVAATLRWRRSWAETLWSLARLRMPPGGIARVAYAATKADHVSSGQRGNLLALLGVLTGQGEAQGDVPAKRFALASIRCTRDSTMSLGGRPVSAVEGRVAGQGLIRSYPGEVPPGPPDDSFWAEGFYAMPEFEPPRLRPGAAIPNVGMDALLDFLLDGLL